MHAELLILTVIILVVLLIVGIYLGNKPEGDQWGITVGYLEGLDSIPIKERIGLVTKKEGKYVEIEVQKNKIILPFNQIIQVNFILWEKTIVKALNPMAEGIVGGILGGSTMAVVSAIDAKGRTRTEKVKIPHALEIQYHPRGDSRTVKSIIMDPGYPMGQEEKWARTLCRCAGLPEPQYIEPKPKGPTYL